MEIANVLYVVQVRMRDNGQVKVPYAPLLPQMHKRAETGFCRPSGT